MDCHNFCFDTGYKIYDSERKLIKSNMSNDKPISEGSIDITIKNNIGNELYNHSQPMKSFVANFIHTFYYGQRLGSYYMNFIGSSSDPVTIDNYKLVLPTNASQVFNNTNYIFERFEVNDNNVCVIVSLQTDCNSNATVREIGLPCNDNNNIFAREVLPSNFNIYNGDNIKITWRLTFPQTNEKVLTKNYFNNLVQKLTTNFTDFVTTSGTNTTGSNSPFQGTFTTCYRAQYDDGYYGVLPPVNEPKSSSVGIVIGTNENETPLSWTNYKLDSQLPTSKISYGKMTNMSKQTKSNYSFGTLFREFTNISSNNIIIREAGVIGHSTGTSGTDRGVAAGNYLIARWLTGDIELRPNETLRVYWQPKVTC